MRGSRSCEEESWVGKVCRRFLEVGLSVSWFCPARSGDRLIVVGQTAFSPAHQSEVNGSEEEELYLCGASQEN